MTTKVQTASRWGLWLLFALGLTATLPCALAKDPCAEFGDLVHSTYSFKPSKLSQAERASKSEAMDKVWSTVEANPKAVLPCLRAELSDPKADHWFRFDGSSLLVKLDPSAASKAIQVRAFLDVDLADASLRTWIETLSQRAAEGADVSEGALRWLDYPEAQYYLPEHGAYEVNREGGAFFLLGCMDEAKALPVLLKLSSARTNEHREFALSMLTKLATPEALQALKSVDLETVSPRGRQVLRTLLTKPQLITPREGRPKIARAKYLKAFGDASKGKWETFDQLVEKVPDGERDAVAVLKAEDLPLLRQVRRSRLAFCNPHAIEYYDDFTRIILTLVWKAGPLK
jgi:hypothetical protein